MAQKSEQSRVKDSDLWLIFLVLSLALMIIVVFGVALFLSGLLQFPDMAHRQDRAPSQFYGDALAFRERRLALALLLRTFLSGFAFVVGLCLSTMGGVFILRQVESQTKIYGARQGGAETMGDKMPSGGFRFEAYSPGVVFLLGGIAVISVTLWLAIPVQAPEIAPPGLDFLCQDPASQDFVQCAHDTAASADASAPADPCAVEGDDKPFFCEEDEEGDSSE